jgi:hypothetical protein
MKCNAMECHQFATPHVMQHLQLLHQLNKMQPPILPEALGVESTLTA